MGVDIPDAFQRFVNDRAGTVLHCIETGSADAMVGINSFAIAASEAPIGSTNQSGMGREGGSEGIRDYLHVKSSQMV
jgi:acyl-CoA reductase-like NAD-dependent aldehyde dehydrogenase